MCPPPCLLLALATRTDKHMREEMPAKAGSESSQTCYRQRSSTRRIRLVRVQVETTGDSRSRVFGVGGQRIVCSTFHQPTYHMTILALDFCFFSSPLFAVFAHTQRASPTHHTNHLLAFALVWRPAAPVSPLSSALLLLTLDLRSRVIIVGETQRLGHICSRKDLICPIHKRDLSI